MLGSDRTGTVVRFRFHGRMAHFARAETQTTILSYPVPPRTALLGLAGAILGMPKDAAPVLLQQAQVAVAGRVLRSHWHTAKLRKDPPEALPPRITSKQAAERSTRPEKASLITQEWLIGPDYTVWMVLPHPYHVELRDRVFDKRWHFSPCLGLSEMMASLSDGQEFGLEALDPGTYRIRSVVRWKSAEIDVADALDRSLGLSILSMPREVTLDRVFTHERYVIEAQGGAVRVRTNNAYEADGEVIVFL